MVDISQSIGMPTIFIRYNPDEYKINKKKADNHFNVRMKDLSSFLNHYINMDINELANIGFLSVIYLYYDDYILTSVKLKTILQFDTIAGTD